MLNYDKILEKEFGIEYCIRESLSFSLQLFPSTQNLTEAVKSNPDALRIKEFINAYRSALSTEVLESGQYSFKAFLVQVANHKSEDALPIQFIKYDDLNEDEKRNVNRVVALIKVKERAVSGKDLYLPGKVVSLVQEGLGNPQVERNGKLKDKFNSDTHTRCWKKYGVRPMKSSTNPSHTDTQYCIYDEPTGHYRYTRAWIDLLIQKMNIDGEYNALF